MTTFFDSTPPAAYNVRTAGTGPAGALPVDDDMLRNRPSGDLFGWTQDAGMGWDPQRLGSKEFLLLGTMGGIREPDGRPVALGYHTGHWEAGLLMEAAARELSELGAIPFAGFCTDPCDGRTQGTAGMFDSLAYRNDAAMVLRRLIRSLPTRRGLVGVATCDKGHPAMMMALAGCASLPSVLVPGGVTLPAAGAEDAGAVQSLGARYAHGLVSLGEAAELGCRAAARPAAGVSSWEQPQRPRSSGRPWVSPFPIRRSCRPGRRSGWRSPGSRRARLSTSNVAGWLSRTF